MKLKISAIEVPGKILVATGGLRVLVDTRDHELAAVFGVGDELEATPAESAIRDAYTISLPNGAGQVRCSIVRA